MKKEEKPWFGPAKSFKHSIISWQGWVFVLAEIILVIFALILQNSFPYVSLFLVIIGFIAFVVVSLTKVSKAGRNYEEYMKEKKRHEESLKKR